MISWSSIKLFLWLCVFRILNTFVIQSYFDPDEFWQTMEPAYCTVFRSNEGFQCPGFTWEWKRRAENKSVEFISGGQSNNLLAQSLWGPARTYASVLPTDLFFRIVQRLEEHQHPVAALWNMNTEWMIARGPMILYAILYAAPTDYAVWFCAQALYPPASGTIPFWCLFASVTSWFHAYTMVRTFANAQESFLLMTSIGLVRHEFLGSTERKHNLSPGGSLWRARIAFVLGGLCLSIRGTSGIAYVTMGIILAFQEYQSWTLRIWYLLSVCAMSGLLGMSLAVAVDYWYFGFVTMPFLGNLHFNVILDHAALFGAHPWYWYWTAGIPAISGILLPFLMMEFVTIRTWTTRGRRNLWILVLSYTWAMSMNGHKEFRYILPLLPLFCLLVGEQLHRVLNRNSPPFGRFLCLSVFIIGNLLAVLYLGLFHQSGPITVNRKIQIMATTQSLGRYSNGSLPLAVHRVDYWTGACHSGPLLSALHTSSKQRQQRRVHFQVRTLDCSPSCRVDPDTLCETDQFHQDPVAFLQNVYTSATTLCVSDVDQSSSSGTCHMASNDDYYDDYHSATRSPSFVVTMSNYVDRIHGYLTNEMGLQQVGRYAHHMNGAKIFGWVLGEDEFSDDNKNKNRNIDIVKGCVQVSVEDVVLYAHETLVPSAPSPAQG